MIKSVDEYILKHEVWQQEIGMLREVLLETDLTETIKWGAPIYTINGKNVIGLGAFKNYVGLWFFQGALLDDKDKVLINAQEGKTKAMRQWRFTSIAEIDIRQVKKYINEAITNQKAGREIKPVKVNLLIIPDELYGTLNSDAKLKLQFEKLTPYKKREYAEYISEAKRDTTKVLRLEKIKPMILAGKGLHDKYR